MSKRYRANHATYKGRMPRGKRNAIIIAAVTCLAIIVGAVYYVVQNYIVYTAQGFYFDFPFLTASNKKPVDSDIVEIDKDKKPTDKTENKTEEPAKKEPEPIKTTQAIYGDILQLADVNYRAQLIQKATQAGANAIALTICDETGILNIPPVGEAKEGSANKNATEFAKGIAELKAANFDIIGIVSACRNNFGTNSMRTAAIQTKNSKRWIDSKKIGWFNPAEQGTKDYISEIIKACKLAGISEVVLDNISYPTNGQANLIKQNPNIDRAQAIADVISAAKSVAGNMKVSAVLTDQAAALAEDTLGGQIAIMMASSADGLVANAVTPALETAITNINKDCRLIQLIPIEQNPSDKTKNYILK